MVTDSVTVMPSITVLKSSPVLFWKRFGFNASLTELTCVTLKIGEVTRLPFIQTAKMSLKAEPVNSGYSSDANWNCSDITLPVGMKSTSRIAASKVDVPAAALSSGSLFGPGVLVDVLALRFGSPLDWV